MSTHIRSFRHSAGLFCSKKLWHFVSCSLTEIIMQQHTLHTTPPVDPSQWLGVYLYSLFSVDYSYNSILWAETVFMNIFYELGTSICPLYATWSWFRSTSHLLSCALRNLALKLLPNCKLYEFGKSHIPFSSKWLFTGFKGAGGTSFIQSPKFSDTLNRF